MSFSQGSCCFLFQEWHELFKDLLCFEDLVRGGFPYIWLCFDSSMALGWLAFVFGATFRRFR